MRLSLGFSPCPNDTFIFHALTHGLLNHEFTFSEQIEDVETLNQMLVSGESPDICKVSMGAYAFIHKEYEILHSGAALGFGVGPLLLSNHPQEFDKKLLQEKTILIPGKLTTAHFLLQNALNGKAKTKECVFSEIESKLKKKEHEYGVIIHENRFTYEKAGLHKVLDLGTYWEEQNKMPIPLGVIVIKRSLSPQIKRSINLLIRKSIEHAFQNPADSYNFRRKHASDMNENVMQQHISLYVNDFSVELGTVGQEAIYYFLNSGEKLNILPKIEGQIFIES